LVEGKMATVAQESDSFVVQLGSAEGAEDVSLMEPVASDQQMVLSFQNVVGHVPVLSLGKQKGLLKGLLKGKKQTGGEKAEEPEKKPQTRQVKTPFSFLAGFCLALSCTLRTSCK
jgi:hypothetical protein